MTQHGNRQRSALGRASPTLGSCPCPADRTRSEGSVGAGRRCRQAGVLRPGGPRPAARGRCRACLGAARRRSPRRGALHGQAGEAGAAGQLALFGRCSGSRSGWGAARGRCGRAWLPRPLGVEAKPVARAAALKLRVPRPAAERAWAGAVAAVADPAVTRRPERHAEVHDDGLAAAGAPLTRLSAPLADAVRVGWLCGSSQSGCPVGPGSWRV
jgi:hypothetical protein